MTFKPQKLSSFKTDEVRSIFKQSKYRFRSSGLEVIFAPKTKYTARILVITPRRVGPAVKRNLIRRRIKEIFRIEKLYTKEFDLIVLVKNPRAIELSFIELKKNLLDSFAKIANSQSLTLA